MPVTVEWDDAAQTVARIDFIGRWTAQEFQAIIFRSAELAQSRADDDGRIPTVDVILNFERSQFTPTNALTLARFALATAPDSRRVVVTGGTPLTNSLARMLTRTFSSIGRMLLVAESLDAARRLLEAQDK